MWLRRMFPANATSFTKSFADRVGRTDMDKPHLEEEADAETGEFGRDLTEIKKFISTH